jgi:hypothetical protein
MTIYPLQFPIATARCPTWLEKPIVVPRHHPHQRAVLHLGLVHMEGGGTRVVKSIETFGAVV